MVNGFIYDTHSQNRIINKQQGENIIKFICKLQDIMWDLWNIHVDDIRESGTASPMSTNEKEELKSKI